MIYELKNALKRTQNNDKNLLSEVQDMIEIFKVPYATKLTYEKCEICISFNDEAAFSP